MALEFNSKARYKEEHFDVIMTYDSRLRNSKPLSPMKTATEINKISNY